MLSTETAKGLEDPVPIDVACHKPHAQSKPGRIHSPTTGGHLVDGSKR